MPPLLFIYLSTHYLRLTVGLVFRPCMKICKLPTINVISLSLCLSPSLFFSLSLTLSLSLSFPLCNFSRRGHGSVGEIDETSGSPSGADEVSVWAKVPHRSPPLLGQLDRVSDVVRWSSYGRIKYFIYLF